MEVINANTKKDIIEFIEQLGVAVKNSEELDLNDSSVLVLSEYQKITDKFDSELGPSGWTEVKLNIRFREIKK